MSKVEDFDAYWTTKPADDPALEQVSLVMAARSMIVARRALEEQLPIAFIADPVIDVLMALYVARADGDASTLSDLRSTTVSPGVVRRWLEALATERLVAIDETSVTLTPEGDARVTAAIRAVIRSQIGLHGQG
jgi:hypothetical protein